MMSHHRPVRQSSQRGYALLMVMFLATVLLLGSMAAAPYVRTERQREKEEEMIWRGKQYVRGVKLYYRKMGRFPTSTDDLTKPKLGSLRFMRQAYKDPMNKQDGSWRLIYVGPAGQLIGSLKPPRSFQMPGQPGVPAATVAQQSSSFGNSGLSQPSTQGQQSAGQPGANGTQTTGSGATDNAPKPTANDDAAANAAPSGMVSSDTPLMGGNIVGVGSKVNRRSVIVYDKAKNYRLFEFVWDPSKEMANAINQQIGTPNNNAQGVGQTGIGQQNKSQGNQQNNQQNPPANPSEPPADMPMPTPPPGEPPVQ